MRLKLKSQQDLINCQNWDAYANDSSGDYTMTCIKGDGTAIIFDITYDQYQCLKRQYGYNGTPTPVNGYPAMIPNGKLTVTDIVSNYEQTLIDCGLL